MILKNIYFVLLCACVVGPHVSQAQSTASIIEVDGYAAKVNHQVITRNDVRQAMMPQLPEIYEKFQGSERENMLLNLYQQVREQLIEEALISAEFLKRGAYVPDFYVESEIDRIIREQFNRDRSRFDEELIQNKKSYETFFDETRKRLGNSMLIGDIMRQQSHVSPEKIRRIYEENLDDYLIPGKIKYSLITIFKGATEEEQELKKQEIKNIKNQLDTGASFSALAQEFSEGNRAEEGGAYPWLQLKDLPKTFVPVIKTLQAGQYSSILEEDERFVIIHIDARRAASYQPFNEVRDSIEKVQIQRDRQSQYQQFIDKLKESHYVIRYD
jgi:parvulin-like peptidyl-prolyl isomerase